MYLASLGKGRELWTLNYMLNTAWKVSVFGNFLIRIFWFRILLHSPWIGEIRSISPYSVRMRDNTDQKNSKYGHFSCSVKHDNTFSVTVSTFYVVFFTKNKIISQKTSFPNNYRTNSFLKKLMRSFKNDVTSNLTLLQP